MRLSDLKTGESALIVKVLGHGAFRKRVIEMGFFRGRSITAVLSAPMKDPVKYHIMDYEVSLRRSESKLIEVMPLPEEDKHLTPDQEMKREAERLQGNLPGQAKDENWSSSGSAGLQPDEAPGSSDHQASEQQRTINIALVGNPNCGKTSLFNVASGAQEHVGNYSGVTVDSKSGTFDYGGFHFYIVDLPGTYSLSAYSPEEKYVRTYLHDNEPDVIVNVVDASNLERNLYLTTELIDIDHPMVIALNMYDELRRSGTKLDYERLAKTIGVPIVPTVSRTGEGFNELFNTIIRVYERHEPAVRHVHVSLGHDLEQAIKGLKDAIKQDKGIDQHYSPRYLAMRLMEHDPEAEEAVKESPRADDMLQLRDQKLAQLAEHHPDRDLEGMIAAEKYGFIAGALAETRQLSDTHPHADTTKIIDSFVTNRLFGFPLFLGFMLFIFWFTFVVGSYPQGWIQALVDWLAGLVHSYMPEGPLKDLLANGVIGGVGSVIVFLPNILLLFFFISFMEDTGYLARAAFIMDRTMHKIGLHGKSFIPLLMGFGCGVPAIMATRTIESPSSKIITILITPFMSCSARLPVYVLLIGTFFEPVAAWVFLGLYVLGVIAAVITSRLLRHFLFKKDETPFVMELPPYRLPTLKTTLRHMWWKGKQYLQKMGGIILVASVIVWALDYFPIRTDEPAVPTSEAAADAATHARMAEQQQTVDDSYLESIGKFVSPVLEPLGFPWKATVAAIAAIPAKEIVVSTLGVLYTGSDEATEVSLHTRLTSPNPQNASAAPDFTPAVALSFMIFILLYCPCMATLVAIGRETGYCRWVIFSALYNTLIAWFFAFCFYHLTLFL